MQLLDNALQSGIFLKRWFASSFERMKTKIFENDDVTVSDVAR